MKSRIDYFVKYSLKARRYRIGQYLPYYVEEYNINIYELFGENQSKGKALSIWLPFDYVKRIIQVLKVCLLSKGNLIIIEYELFPYLPPIFEAFLFLFKKNVIFDYDDATFHKYDSQEFIYRYILWNKFQFIGKYAKGIITGSSYLSDYFKALNDNIIEIPTSVETREIPKPCFNINEPLTIGWIGSESTSKELLHLVPTFHELQFRKIPIRIVFCGFSKKLEHFFEKFNVEFMDWSEENEKLFMSKIDVGIMPLEDSLWNRGKCAFKLIQYMAYGKPTISSPLKSNKDINKREENLFALGTSEWLNAILEINANRSNYYQIGINNQEIVDTYYSCKNNSLKYKNFYNKNLI